MRMLQLMCGGQRTCSVSWFFLSWVSDSGCQAWQQASLSTQPSQWPQEWGFNTGVWIPTMNIFSWFTSLEWICIQSVTISPSVTVTNRAVLTLCVVLCLLLHYSMQQGWVVGTESVWPFKAVFICGFIFLNTSKLVFIVLRRGFTI